MIEVGLHQTVRYRGALDRSTVVELLSEHRSAETSNRGDLSDLSDPQLGALLSQELLGGNYTLGEVIFEMIEKHNEVTREEWQCWT